jgi:hypothetical protein
MTKIAITPNASGTGIFTLTSPSSNTNRTFTLPDATGEVLTDQSDLAAAKLTGNVASARITDALNASGSAPIYACRAWVSVDGTTTPPNIRGSGNVSSVSRVATGVFDINFLTAMPDANYSFSITANEVQQFVNAVNLGGIDPTANTARVRIRNSSGTNVNVTYILAAFFR